MKVGVAFSMPNELINAFTVAAFAFTLLGILRASDLLFIVLLSLVLTKAAPALHKSH